MAAYFLIKSFPLFKVIGIYSISYRNRVRGGLPNQSLYSENPVKVFIEVFRPNRINSKRSSYIPWLNNPAII
jgi:hypothetical protein